MATWFATAGGNINTAGRWNSAPDGSGDTLTWPPDPADILVTNSRGITVNVATTVAQLRADDFGGATATGTYTLVPGATLTGTLYAGRSTYSLYYAGTGTVTFVGDIYGDTSGVTANTYVVWNNAGGTINITGNLYASQTNSNGRGVTNRSTGTINITGNVYSGLAGNQYGVIQDGVGAINVTGNVISLGTYGAVCNNAAGAIHISGYAQASNTQSAVINGSTGIVEVGETRSAVNGRGAVLGAFRYASATAAVSKPIIAGTQKTLSVLDVAALVPAVEDVRAGVTYGDGAYTGTLPLNRKRLSMAGRF